MDGVGKPFWRPGITFVEMDEKNLVYKRGVMARLLGSRKRSITAVEQSTKLHQITLSSSDQHRVFTNSPRNETAAKMKLGILSFLSAALLASTAVADSQ